MRRAKTPRPSEGRPQLPDTLPSAASLEDLEEITVWLGTFRERLRIAHAKDRKTLEATVKELERRGHIVEVDADWCEGRLTAAARDGRRRRAAANPRGMQGYAAGR